MIIGRPGIQLAIGQPYGRGDVSRRLPKGLGRYTVVSVLSMLLAGAVFSALDLNDPDGVSVAPSLTTLLAFVLVVNTIGFLFLRRLAAIQRAEDWTSLAVGQLVLMLLAVMWYRVFWLRSIYVESALSDHFTYLRQAEILEAEPMRLMWVMNSIGMSLVISWLFRWFEASSFYIVALNAALLSWAAAFLVGLSVRSDLRSGRRGDSFVGLSFQVLPLSVLLAGLISKDAYCCSEPDRPSLVNDNVAHVVCGQSSL